MEGRGTSRYRAILGIAFVGALLLLTSPALAQCPEGTVQIGEQEVRSGNTIYVHPLCRRMPATVPAAPPPAAPPARTYRPSGNGFVGGLGARFGYYSPVGASPQVRARALQMLRDQDRAADRHYADEIDLERYNFAVGIAKDTALWDFGSRVVLEQLRNGQHTARPNHQSAYNYLRDRQFDELGCHSNGAMTCLAALWNEDVRASNVVLYGPQITVESIALWNELLAQRRIASLEIVVAQNDPVPPLALLVSPAPALSPFAAALAAPILFNVDDLATGMRAMSPGAVVSTFSCGTRPGRECHDMARYTAHRRR